MRTLARCFLLFGLVVAVPRVAAAQAILAGEVKDRTGAVLPGVTIEAASPALIEKVRAARPDIAISGDFIVGFPGESDEDFTATLSIVDAVRYASAYSFKYSARPGTPAALMEGAVAQEVMDERLQRLQARIAEHSLAFNRATIGKDTRILIDRKGRLPGQMIGKSPWLQSVFVETDAKIGDMLDVTLTGAFPNSLSGALRSAAAA